MVQVLADYLLGVPVIVPLNHQVAAGTHANFIRDVARKNELALVPLDFDLPAKLATIGSDAVVEFAHPLVSDVQIMPTDMIVEPLGILGVEE